MESEKAEAQYRHQSFVPDPQSKESAQWYLSRTTFLWNYLVEATQLVYDNYLLACQKSGQSKETDDALEAQVWAHFEDIYRTDYDKVIPEKWLSFIECVRELPRSMTEQRLIELISAYKSSAVADTDGSVDLRNRPRRKTARSGQSAVFNTGEFTVTSENQVRCEACPGQVVEIPLTGLIRHVSDVITRDRILKIMIVKPHKRAGKGDVADKFGPIQEDTMRAVFYLKS